MHLPSPARFLLPIAAAWLSLALLPAGAQDDLDIFASHSQKQQNGGVRIVSCDEQVRSQKRGICMNEMSQADFAALAPGVSWYYNWHYETKYRGISGNIQFIPMMWGNRPEALRGLDSTLASASPKPPVVLCINEPNLKGQAFITPEQTANLYRETKEVTDRYHIPLVGPNMALGSANGDSITAQDPIENKMVTYNFMVPFLKATLFYLKPMGITPPALAFHSYGAAGEIKWAVQMMHQTFNCPIWVTEYAQWKNPDSESAVKYMIESTDFLERTPYVAGYAWFKDRVKDNPNISLLDKESGKLTQLGETYVTLPAHDSTIYYKIPGQLQAGNYVTAEGADIRPTADTGGPYQMAANTSGATLDYNIQVDSPGAYTLGFRTAGAAGKFDVMENGQVIGSAQSAGGNDWHTVQAAIPLNAGMQKIRVRYNTSGICLHWIEFVRR
ncbi:MAG TPA: glycosyl hydrolase [Chthoniobacteraceae bacterium]|jgi:hypothetical protein|nr:glycosyl hydrolase [Chthoniobacteraceae bacterium]